MAICEHLERKASFDLFLNIKKHVCGFHPFLNKTECIYKKIPQFSVGIIFFRITLKKKISFTLKINSIFHQSICFTKNFAKAHQMPQQDDACMFKLLNEKLFY